MARYKKACGSEALRLSPKIKAGNCSTCTLKVGRAQLGHRITSSCRHCLCLVCDKLAAVGGSTHCAVCAHRRMLLIEASCKDCNRCECQAVHCSCMHRLHEQGAQRVRPQRVRMRRRAWLTLDTQARRPAGARRGSLARAPQAAVRRHGRWRALRSTATGCENVAPGGSCQSWSRSRTVSSVTTPSTSRPPAWAGARGRRCGAH